MNDKELINYAIQASERAYAPYSGFKVGAALLTKDNELFLGSNIENSSYSLTCCAERVAIFKAISEGETRFKKLAVVANTDKPVSPCGACRQVMSEFFDDDVRIYLANKQAESKEVKISDLLPNAFSIEK
ncbi:MAG TPA: cytidine deaminase [Pseudogracilibacillus sp.]|nr:cytidine deaminase [Pseudogracilibacillus sp.]